MIKILMYKWQLNNNNAIKKMIKKFNSISLLHRFQCSNSKINKKSKKNKV